MARIEATVIRQGSYTVQDGDTLWGIAERVYGDGRQYPRICAANRQMFGGDQVRITGQRLCLPGVISVDPFRV
jgi:nucleoid-associated protein YgaU